MPPEPPILSSVFHIAQRLDVDVSAEIFSAAHRALKPGGILILETSNPENIVVSSLNFYIDLTHKNPLPPKFMRFLVSKFRFVRSEFWRLNHDPSRLSEEGFSLRDVLDGLSPDSALIVKKGADRRRLKTFDTVFFCPPELGSATLIQNMKAN